jgi:hypothetical protein
MNLKNSWDTASQNMQGSYLLIILIGRGSGCVTQLSAVGIAPQVRAARSGVLIQAGTRDFSLLQTVQTSSGANSASSSMHTGVLSLWCSRQGMIWTSLSSAEFKNEYTHTCSPPVGFHGFDRDNFTSSCLGDKGFHIDRNIATARPLHSGASAVTTIYRT